MSHTSQPSDVLATLYDAINTGDITHLRDLIAPDILVIGTDDDEWLQGSAQVLPALAAQFRGLNAAGVTLTPGLPTAGSDDHALWVGDAPRMRLPDGSDTLVRVTLVATKDQRGQVSIRQLHLSFGVPNEQVFDVELPIS